MPKNTSDDETISEQRSKASKKKNMTLHAANHFGLFVSIKI